MQLFKELSPMQRRLYAEMTFDMCFPDNDETCGEFLGLCEALDLPEAFALDLIKTRLEEARWDRIYLEDFFPLWRKQLEIDFEIDSLETLKRAHALLQDKYHENKFKDLGDSFRRESEVRRNEGDAAFKCLKAALFPEMKESAVEFSPGELRPNSLLDELF